MNIEHRTSNIECRMEKDETEELIKIFVTRVSKRPKRNHALAWLNVRYWMFVFNSMLDVRCSMLDVYLSKKPRMA